MPQLWPITTLRLHLMARRNHTFKFQKCWVTRAVIIIMLRQPNRASWRKGLKASMPRIINSSRRRSSCRCLRQSLSKKFLMIWGSPSFRSAMLHQWLRSLRAKRISSSVRLKILWAHLSKSNAINISLQALIIHMLPRAARLITKVRAV